MGVRRHAQTLTDKASIVRRTWIPYANDRSTRQTSGEMSEIIRRFARERMDPHIENGRRKVSGSVQTRAKHIRRHRSTICIAVDQCVQVALVVAHASEAAVHVLPFK